MTIGDHKRVVRKSTFTTKVKDPKMKYNKYNKMPFVIFGPWEVDPGYLYVNN